MSEQGVAFQVGDHVIHWSYGLGEIIELDEKVISGKTRQYYVVKIRDLTLWVSRDDTSEKCLRFPTQPAEFKKLFTILASPGDPLPADRFLRKNQLTLLLKDRTLESLCRVIRDLVVFKRTNKINDSDYTTLNHAKELLLSEWSAALSVPYQQAESELSGLLEVEAPAVP